MRPVIFVSYSHRDSEEKEKLLSHLRVLKHLGEIEDWSDERIPAGSDWQEEISRAISQAHVAILLVTANYLDSPFISEKELPLLQERARNKGLTVVPIIAKPCAWRLVEWLKSMQVLPPGGTPVWGDKGTHVEEDLTLIVEKVAAILQKMPVDLPRQEAEPPGQPDAPTTPAAKIAGRKILIVDDDPAYRRSVRAALKGKVESDHI